jgi:amino acid transporter
VSGTSRPAAPESEPLPRQLSALGVWLLIINGTIGAGIFGLPGEAARLAGAFSPWVFVLCAALMLPIMLSFAELSSHFTGTGGPVKYTGAVYGPFAGFQAGWAFYVARLTAFSANLVLLVTTLGYFWPAAGEPGLRLALLFLLTAAFVWLNVVGAKQAIRSLGVLTLLKFLPLIALVAVGLWQMPTAVLTAVQGELPVDTPLGRVVLIVFYAYVGFESGLVPAGEARDPRRDMPRALVWAIAVVAVLYFLLQSVSLAALPNLGAAQRPLVEVGAVLLGPAGAVLLTLGVIVSVGGNLVGSMFSTPRVTYSLALAGQLPAWFARVHARFQTPHVSILFYGVLAFLLAAGGSFVWLAGLSVVTRVLIYIACISTLPTLRRRHGDEPSAVRLPGGYLIPGVAVLVCLWLLTNAAARDFVVTAVFLAVGSGLYWLAQRRN